MAKEVLMPLLSPSMTEGTLVRWLKKENDEVKSGEVIAEVETDKATMDLEAFDSGVLRKILVKEGTKVPINSRIAIIGSATEKIDEALLKTSVPEKTEVKETKATVASSDLKQAPAPLPTAKHTSVTSTAVIETPRITTATGRVKASPLAKKIAKEKGVDLGYLSGTGPGGRIVKKDVLNGPGGGRRGGDALTLTTVGPIAKEEKIQLSNTRQVIARRLLESKTQIPHFYLQVEIDAKPMLDVRAELNLELEQKKQPLKLSVNDFILKACAEALRRKPIVNSSFQGDSIQQHSNVHLSFAVALEDGLITPIIREAQNKNIQQIHQEARALVVKAREGKLKLDEFTGGTFTISNLGMLGVDNFSAIINPPQAAILAVGNIVKKPVVNEQDQIVVGHRLGLTLSCDHRVIDGAVGAQFLQELRHLLENPALLLL